MQNFSPRTSFYKTTKINASNSSTIEIFIWNCTLTLPDLYSEWNGGQAWWDSICRRHISPVLNVALQGLCLKITITNKLGFLNPLFTVLLLFPTPLPILHMVEMGGQGKHLEAQWWSGHFRKSTQAFIFSSCNIISQI